MSSNYKGRDLSELTQEESQDLAKRFLAEEGSLWSNNSSEIEEIEKFLGWIHSPQESQSQVPEIESFVQEVKSEGFTEVVVCGMGGSSLSARVYSTCGFGEKPFNIHVLDTTHPQVIAELTESLNFDKTLFIIASKSGSTIEPLSMEEYFWTELSISGNEYAQNRMVVITDPGSKLHQKAQERKYRKIFLGNPRIGGRFSAFSVFGLVPAAFGGLNLQVLCQANFTEKTEDLYKKVSHLVHTKGNFCSLISNQETEALSLWTEQLIAESTGKLGKGLLPLASEPSANSQTESRFFLDFTSVNKSPNCVCRKIVHLEDLRDTMYDLMVTTAMLGLQYQVNPFDQPDVQLAKDKAKAKLAEFKASGTNSLKSIPDNLPLETLINNPKQNQFFAILGFFPESPELNSLIQEIRHLLSQKTGCPTSFGYGPRYLHSTGQYHKGGINSGKFLLLYAEDSLPLEIPNMDATFNQLFAAQASGDIEALKSKDRPVHFVNLGSNPLQQLKKLKEEFKTLL